MSGDGVEPSGERRGQAWKRRLDAYLLDSKRVRRTSRSSVLTHRSGLSKLDKEEEDMSVFEKAFVGRMFTKALDTAVQNAQWKVSDEARQLLREAFNTAAVEAASGVRVHMNATIESPIDPGHRYPLYYQHLGHARVAGKNCTLKLTPSSSGQALQERDGELEATEFDASGVGTFDRVEIESLTHERFEPSRGGIKARKSRKADQSHKRADNTTLEEQVQSAKRILEAVGHQGSAAAGPDDVEDDHDDEEDDEGFA